MAVPNLDDLKVHLNEETAEHDTELGFMLAAALVLLDAELDRVGASTYTPASTSTNALIQYAVYEVVRDMWSGSQSGGGGRQFGQTSADGEGLFTAGRSAISPYVASLLAPLVTALAPTGSFPDAADWPDEIAAAVTDVNV